MSQIVDRYALSPMQQGMLFHHLIGQQPGVDILQLLCALHEDLDVPAFVRGWRRLVDRHAALRTSLRWQGLEEPLQEVHRRVDLAVEQDDWRGAMSREQDERLRAYLEGDRRRGFRLDEPPLMRLAIFRVGEADYRVVWTTHHIVLDGWIHPTLLDEAFAFYEAERRGDELRLPAPRPYHDYIEWLRRQDQSPGQAFWRRLLQGFASPTPLVVDRSPGRPRDGGPAHGSLETWLSMGLTSELQGLAERRSLTLNTLVQGAWAVLLSRYSGEEDVVFGATRACRRAAVAGAESMVGLFINTLPVRARIPPDARLLALLKELREQSLAVRPFEHTPLVKVKEWGGFPGGLPLFESAIVFNRESLNTTMRRRGGAWLNREFRLLGQSGYPLTGLVYAEPELRLRIDYDRTRFDDATIARMLGHVETLLGGMVDDPEQRIATLPLLPESERRLSLVEWNDTSADYPVRSCIHELFEAQVERTPDAAAVVFDEERITYRELNRRANRLAHLLRSLGVGPEVLVGLCTRPSLAMVEGILGILKAGGAYVPLDPASPAQRLAFMLADTRAPVLVTQEDLLTGLPDHPQVLCLDRDRQAVSGRSEANPASGVKPDNLAYVIYTSGSTGGPKGVLVEHRQLVNYVHAVADRVGLAPGASFAMVQPLTVDSCKTVIYPPLLAGGCLHVIDRERAADGDALGDYLDRHRIDCLKIAPSHLAALATAAQPRRLLPARWLILGGEVSHWDFVEALESLGGDCAIFNHYGPTETTVGVLAYRVARDETGHRSATATVPIGRPLANTRAYLLDRRLRPVPVGAPGELCIGGAAVVRGYLDRPELTAESFIPDPFSGVPGARLYRTGDLARRLPDGNVELLGRIDQQVKIRGFRVEPGEIEAALTQHPGVREAVVVAREGDGSPAEKLLVACVVPDHAPAPSAAELRDFLKERLPELMVPAAFVALSALPLTPHGKIDRRALPPPGWTGPDRCEAAAAPRTAVEAELVRIWTDVLDRREVGIHDDFFDLGGHSLLATRVVSRIRQRLDVDLPLRRLFELPTIARLAVAIEALVSREAQAPDPHDT